MNCPTCGQATLEGGAACGFCGTRLRDETPPPQASRRVTVFFSDLKGSTSLGEKLDSEALREVLARYFDAMTAELQRYGGTIEKFIGDAIMAVFGLPSARPDDPVRAVQGAAATTRALARLNDELERTYGVRLVNRTGLATGDVLVGVASAGEHVLTGEVVRVASRMEQSAPPSGVLIDEHTLEAVRELAPEFVAEPAVASAGAGAALAAYRLVEAPPDAAVAVAAISDAICRVCGATNPVVFRFCSACGATLSAVTAQETRRTVTIVFSDLHATDARGDPLPPALLRTVLSRGFDAARAELERHGATVEKYVGDAVMAVFGLPVLHEDDALRAVRAAAAMARAVAGLGPELGPGVHLTSRTGVNTGEVVAGDATFVQRLVTGDTVNTAARLEQAAPDDAVLLGPITHALVREAVDAEAVEPLSLKGKAQRVPAFRLLGLRSDARPSAQDSRMIGRDDELRRLRELFEETVARNVPRTVTVVGDAGIGKSRLVRELDRDVADRATVLRGRCLSYGDGITFWPIIEIVRSAAGIQDDDSPMEAQQKVVGVVEDAGVAERLGAIVGLTAMSFPMAELFWAVRRFCEILAERRPLVLVVDGFHWASPSFVELIDHLRSNLSAGRVLLVLMARHELLESQPEWGTDADHTLLSLPPLSTDDTASMLAGLLHRDASPVPAPTSGRQDREARLVGRILDVAEGNPLFVEQVVSMLIDTGALRLDDDRWVLADDRSEVAVPPTIQALLASRVDAVPRVERQVLEPAAVIGHAFAQPAVEAIVEESVRPEVAPSLVSLERRQLVRLDAAASTAESWYRFQNLLIRDAAYRALLKRTRAALHERFVAWADGVNRERGREREFEEISGYHLEQSYRYRRELGLLDDAGVSIGKEAARRLTAAGRRAFERGDMPAAANLLGRSVDLLPLDDAGRRELLPEVAEARMELGEFDQARRAVDEAIASGESAGDATVPARARLIGLLLDVYAGAGAEWGARASRQARAFIPAFEDAGDHVGLTLAWRVLFGVQASALRCGDAALAADQVVHHARLAGDRRLEARGATGYAQAALLGPASVVDALERCHELLARIAGDRRSEAMVLLSIAELEALEGSFDASRQHAAHARSMFAELGQSVAASSTSMNSWRADALAGDLEAAELELRRDYVALDAIGERYMLSTVAGLLARIVLATGRVEEAASLVERSRDLADADDIGSQALWRSVQAKVLARRGQPDPAVVLAREAVAVLETADSPVLVADALVDQAETLATIGRPVEACTALLEAGRLFDAKGAAAAVEDVRARLSSFGWQETGTPV